MCMTDAGTTQDYFILPAPPVGGLPISQDWLDRMKLVHDRTVPIILPSGEDILVDANILARQILAVCLKEGGHHNSRILGTYTNYLAHNVMTRALSGKVLLTNC